MTGWLTHAWGRGTVRESNTCHDPSSGRFCSEGPDAEGYTRLLARWRADTRTTPRHPFAALYYKDGPAEDHSRGWNILSQHTTRVAAERAFRFFDRAMTPAGRARLSHLHVVDLRAR